MVGTGDCGFRWTTSNRPACFDNARRNDSSGAAMSGLRVLRATENNCFGYVAKLLR